MAENPVRVARMRLGASIREFADRVGIHPQAVYLLESGVYNTPLPSVTRYLKSVGFDVTRFESEYALFRLEKTREEGSKLGVPTLTVAALGEPGASPLEALRGTLGVSRMGFCKKLCIHPAYELKCERGQSASLGHQIKESLVHAGLDPSVVEELDERQHDYHEAFA